MTEAQIISGSLAGNKTAQGSLYKSYSPKMMGVCYRFAKSRSDAEEMLQEGFIRIFQQLHQFRNEGSFEGWIRRTIVHTCINILKRNKKHEECADISVAIDIPSAGGSVYSMMATKHIIECIRMLPLGYRTVLNLYAIEGYSHKEISTMLEMEESTCRSRYLRAKRMLEKILIEHGIIEKSIRYNNKKTERQVI